MGTLFRMVAALSWRCLSLSKGMISADLGSWVMWPPTRTLAYLHASASPSMPQPEEGHLYEGAMRSAPKSHRSPPPRACIERTKYDFHSRSSALPFAAHKMVRSFQCLLEPIEERGIVPVNLCPACREGRNRSLFLVLVVEAIDPSKGRRRISYGPTRMVSGREATSFAGAIQKLAKRIDAGQRRGSPYNATHWLPGGNAIRLIGYEEEP